MDNKKQRSDGWTNKVRRHLWTLYVKDLPHMESKEAKKITSRCVRATAVLRRWSRSLFLTISQLLPLKNEGRWDSSQNKEAWQDWKDLPFGVFSFKVWVPGYTTRFEKHFPPQTFSGNGPFQLTKLFFLKKNEEPGYFGERETTVKLTKPTSKLNGITKYFCRFFFLTC